MERRPVSTLALKEFLFSNRDRIIARTRAKVANRMVPIATEDELESGIPMFLTQLVGMLKAPPESDSAEIGRNAAIHGGNLLKMGLTIGQVVHDYGGLCQAITEIAGEDDIAISSSDFRMLNACLDDAIASAVSEFGRQREEFASDDGLVQRGVLAHELRNALHVAAMAFEAIREGSVGPNGSTGSILARTLVRMRELVDRSLAEVRLKAAIQTRTHVPVAALIEELAVAAELEARRRGLRFTVGPVERGVIIDADPHTIFSALDNLLQNAFKFTRIDGHVSLRTQTIGDRVRFDVEDGCGGLPTGKVDDLFRVFGQLGTDRSGLGLGLTISRHGVEANGGRISVRDLPGTGCIFTIDLPRLPETDRQEP
jgi:signal transduction histidine kinase